MSPEQSYLICASPRSGSSLLGEALAVTGVAGRPMEHFNANPANEILRSRELGIERDDLYVQAVLYASTTPNGVFGTKLHAFQTPTLLARFSQHANTKFESLREAVESVLPQVRYIFIKRDDIDAQAVSYYRALMTGEWWRVLGVAIPTADESVPFDYFGVATCRSLIEASNEYWEGFFRAHQIEPFRVRYEELSGNYQREIRRVLAFLGVGTHDIEIAPSLLQRMGDTRSRAWIEKYKELSSNRGSIARSHPQWAPY